MAAQHPEAGRLLEEADRLRDAGEWRRAAEAYAAHLALHPADWHVWIQHGHCVKEQGDPVGALASYRRAERGLPRDADLQLQIGHALKLAGDLEGARAAYARSLELDPAGDAAWQEVSALLTRPGAAGAVAEARQDRLALVGDLDIVFDLSDLMSWFGSARAPSGIQRVQMEIVGPALRPTAPVGTVQLAVFRPETGSWRTLPHEVFRRLAALSRAGTDTADPAWQEVLSRAAVLLDAAPDLAFPEGAWLVNLGSSWWLPNYHLAMRNAKARHGIRYAALVHDCGPIVVPEHSEPAVSARFARWFAGLNTQADLLLTVSEATRRDLERLRAAHLPGLPAAPVAVLRLDAAPAAPPAARPHARAAALKGKPYILFVATLESRKDHLFVLHAWLALIRRHGEAIPPLLLVGRAGFMAEPVIALLQRAPELQERVLWLDDVPDGVLAELYAGALFTLYNSHHEGWGLPVTEALAHGRVVVAPAHSGLLEAGQGLALGFQHQSEPDFLALVERLLFDTAFRGEQEARIAASRRLRSWQTISDEMLGLLGAADRVAIAAPPKLGTMHRLAEIEAPVPMPAMAWADLLRVGPNWHAPEPWGCWTRPGSAVLRLPVEAPEGARLRLHVALRGAAVAQRVTLLAEGAEALVLDVAPDARPTAVIDLPAAQPAVEISIKADAAPADMSPGAPSVGIGVVAVMVCPYDDVLSRLTYLEQLAFVWPEPA